MIFVRLSSVIVILITVQSCTSLNQELDLEQTTVTTTSQAKARNLLGVVNNLVAALTGTRAPKRKIFSKQRNEHQHGGKRKFYATLPLPERESVRQDEKNETQIDICSKKYWDVGFHKKVTFGTYNFGRKGKTYTANANCTVLYQGSRHCTPIMNCETPINLRKRINGACNDDYLYISDGLGGAVKYCDNDRIKQMKPSGGGQDFYVKLITGPTNPGLSFTGFKCSVSCETKTNEAIQELRASKKTKKIYNNCVCGLPMQNDDQRIVGGTTAIVNEFPWLVPIVLKGTRQPICGGAIINDRHILTAAHCFVLAELGKDDLDVLVHAHLIDQSITGDIANVPLGGKGSIQGIGFNLDHKTDQDENTTRFGVEEVIIHPMFNDGYDNDVAIMKLNKKIDLISESGVTPICLPKHSAHHEDYNATKATVAGWGLGHEDAAGSNRLLQKLEDIPIIDHHKCEELFNETISDKMLCAGFLEGGKDSCTGDSGGPLITKEPNGQFKQIGIVSWGLGCARKDSPGVYTNVQELLEWINYHTSVDTNVQWCQESPGIID